MRELRKKAGKTQEQLARALSESGRSVSRVIVNRVENGHMPLGREMAAALDSFAKVEDLTGYGFANLVTEQQSHVSDRTRGTDLSRLLGSEDLEKVYVVLCDETDLAALVRSSLSATRVNIVLIVPSAQRITELFPVGARQDSDGEQAAGVEDSASTQIDLFSDYRARLRTHIARQVHRFRRMASQVPGVTIEIFESGAVLNPVIIATRNSGLKCIYWPCTPRGEWQHIPDFLPTAASAEIASWYQNLVLSIIDQESGIASRQNYGDTFVLANEEISVQMEDASRIQKIDGTRFSRFRPRQRESEPEIERVEGKAVVAILPFVWIFAGGKRRAYVLLKRRSKLLSGAESDVDDQLAFVSGRVGADVLFGAVMERRGRDACRLDLSDDLDDQSSLVGNELEVAEATGISDILDAAYKSAAEVELELTYGFVSRHQPLADRLTFVKLEGCAIRKSDGHPIVPRLYAIELRPNEADLLVDEASQSEGNELVLYPVDDLIARLDENGDPIRPKILGEGSKLDDYLHCAMTEELLQQGFQDLLKEMYALRV